LHFVSTFVLLFGTGTVGKLEIEFGKLIDPNLREIAWVAKVNFFWKEKLGCFWMVFWLNG
jgi:hypothetical protein